MLVLNDLQKVVVKVVPVNAVGNPAKVDGAPKWSVSDESILTIQPVEGDEMSVEVVTTGLLGVAQVSVVVDADLGEGVRELTGVLEVEVKASEAVGLTISTGVPVLK